MITEKDNMFPGSILVDSDEMQDMSTPENQIIAQDPEERRFLRSDLANPATKLIATEIVKRISQEFGRF
jgi:hypothetical protein